jgi:hypothetical protein
LLITGPLGEDYREYLVNRVGGGRRGSADLCAYFMLRNLALASASRVGIIASKTISQGPTRAVGLDQALAKDWTVIRAIKSQPWPGTAHVQVALVWLTRHISADEEIFLNNEPVEGITTLLTPRSKVVGEPQPLAANEARAFQGSNLLGQGFILTPEQAEELIRRDPKNEEVLFPYFNGDDLNQHTGTPARRWVINFRDWPHEVAAEYKAPFAIVEDKVKKERSRNKDKRRREIWWRFTRPTIDLYESIEEFDRVLAISQTSSTQLPAFLPKDSVFDQQLVVFPTNSYAELAFRSSGFQYWWTVQYCSTRTADIVYTPTTCCAPLPLPELNDELSTLGRKLEALQKRTGVALTPLSQRIHSPEETAADIVALREVHRQIDYAVLAGYGWDVDLEYDFHETQRGTRYTMSPDAQTRILDLLLQLNHERYEQEVQHGAHRPEAKRRRAAARKAKAKARAAQNSSARQEGFDDGALFADPNALF